MTNLTPKQQRIYDFIRTFTRQMGYPPTVREIGQHVGVRSPSTVKYHLDHLRQAGLLQWDGGKTRSITLPNASLPGPDQIPLVGHVAAGAPIWAEECIEEYIPFQAGPHPEEYFALTKQEGTVRGMLRGVLASTAALAIIPMADWLEEPAAARMNTPGQAQGNWQWRADAKKLTPALAAEIRVLTERYFRAAK